MAHNDIKYLCDNRETNPLGVPGYPMTLYVAESPDYSAAYEHAAANPITYTDPTGCILTDALSSRVNQLEDKIDNKLCMLDKGDAQAIEYNIFKRKLSMLRESDQTYDLKHTWQIREMNADGATVYDNKTGNVVIEMYNSCNLDEIVAHELEHCYQFEIGAYSVAYNEDRKIKQYPGDPVLKNFKTGLYDITDEQRAYNTQNLFDPTGTSRNLYKLDLYENLPREELSSRSLLSPGVIYPDGTDAKSMQQVVDKLQVVFRYRGTTFIPDK